MWRIGIRCFPLVSSTFSGITFPRTLYFFTFPIHGRIQHSSFVSHPTFIHWYILQKLSASHHISEKSSLFVQSTTKKNFTGNLSVVLFQPFLSEHSWWNSPSIKSFFISLMIYTVLPLASQRLHDKDWGYVSRSEPQTLRQALTFIDVILHYQSTIGDGIKWERLVYIHISVQLRRKSAHATSSQFYILFYIICDGELKQVSQIF